MLSPLPRLTSEQVALAVQHIRCVRPWCEISDDVPAIQSGLQARLHCRISVEDVIFLWEHFSEDIFTSGWEVVDADSLDGCACMIQAAYAAAVIPSETDDHVSWLHATPGGQLCRCGDSVRE